MSKPDSAARPATFILAAPNTNAGAMERLFLLEAVTPAYVGLYDVSQNLTAMRLMRQTIENRLEAPAEYSANGATTETDIIELGNQFAGFSTYPTLDAGMTATLTQTLAIASNPSHPLQKHYAVFVADAIKAATEPLSPTTAKYANVTAWRTQDTGSPGPRFRKLATISGNTFYATNPVPSLPPKPGPPSQDPTAAARPRP